MLDPSTNTNPLEHHEHDHDRERRHKQDGRPQREKKSSKDVSKHVFYVVNSQSRLKLYAKNERQMLQWIAALERVARESHYTGRNRFDSFAPIRLNVAAQWLVDGVHPFRLFLALRTERVSYSAITCGISHAQYCWLVRRSISMIGGFRLV